MSKYCVDCGTELTAVSKFCQKCGHKVLDDRPQALGVDESKLKGIQDHPTPKKVSSLKRNVIFSLIFLLILAVAASNLIGGDEERDACRAVSIVLGPINDGIPNVKEFRDTWVVMDAVAEETKNLELKAAIKAFSLAGKTLLSQQTSTGGTVPEALNEFRTKGEELSSICESFS